MFAGIRSRLTYANVASSLALFIAISGGAAFAVTQLDANSVESKHIVNGQVKRGDLGVPAKYESAGLPDQSGAGCEPGNEWRDQPFWNAEVGYYRDPFGIVHLQGTAIKCGTPIDQLFILPAGYRPEGSVLTHGIKNATDFHQVRIFESGEVQATTPGFVSGNNLSLEGITFRCAPSGQDGCP